MYRVVVTAPQFPEPDVQEFSTKEGAQAYFDFIVSDSNLTAWFEDGEAHIKTLRASTRKDGGGWRGVVRRGDKIVAECRDRCRNRDQDGHVPTSNVYGAWATGRIRCIPSAYNLACRLLKEMS